MKKQIYAIYDNCGEMFVKTFENVNDKLAIRDFEMTVVEQPHKNDYELWRLADFNDVSGDIISNKKRLKTGLEVQHFNEDQPNILKDQAS